MPFINRLLIVFIKSKYEKKDWHKLNFASNLIQYQYLQYIYIGYYMKGYLIVALLLVSSLGWGILEQAKDCETENCQVCSQAGNCVMCQVGHVLKINKDTGSSQCVQSRCNIPNCSRCINQNICAQCINGFSLNNFGSCSFNNQGIRSGDNLVQSCKQRAVSGECTLCSNGFNLINGNCEIATLNFVTSVSQSSSQSCVNNIPGCSSCLTPNFCAVCSGSSVPNAQGNACINNCTISNCLLCESSTNCQTCQNGFYLNSNVCIQCQITGCQTCTSNNTCSICYKGYQTNSQGTCTWTGCQYPCALCDSNGTCSTCVSPYVSIPYDNGTCFTCSVANCLTCSGSSLNICSACYLGYTLNQTSNTCTLNCQSPLCTSCTTNTNCGSCVNGYAAIGGVCRACVGAPTCIQCNPANLSICTSCIQGYFVNQTSNTCQPCNVPGCAYNKCNNNGICTQFAGLLTFTYTSTNATTTTTNYVPYLCDVGCANCLSTFPAVCLLCSNGYYMTNPSTTTNIANCLPCGTNCLTCLSTNPNFCQSCYSNAFINITAGTCQVCNPNSNCLTCNSNNLNVCTSCPLGYQVSSSGTCSISCAQNCLTCFNVTSGNQTYTNCSSCTSGYGLTSYGACLPCIANCRICSGQYQQICLQCGQGYFLNSNYACQACSPGCQTCSPIGCISCAPGFNLVVQGTTTVCSTTCYLPCATCGFNTPSVCTSCIAGYTLNANNACQLSTSCIVNGVNGGNSNQCLYCGFGAVLTTSGTCQLCGTGCLRCIQSDANQCTSCNQGYYLVQSTSQSGTGNGYGTCTPCSTGCVLCNGPTNCNACQSGFTLAGTPIGTNQQTCVACALPCAQCYQDPEICTSCINGFTFTGFNCVSNFYYTFSIGLAVTQNQFYNNYMSFMQKLAFSMQTTNQKVASIQSINSNGNTTNVIVFLSTIQPSGSSGAALEYNNLQYALLSGGYFANMPVLNSTLGYVGGVVPNSYSNTGLICGLVIPLGALFLVGLIYLICSRSNMDLPGADWQNQPENIIRQDTQLKAL